MVRGHGQRCEADKGALSFAGGQNVTEEIEAFAYRVSWLAVSAGLFLIWMLEG
jgi:uncharacterized membrane protein